MPFELFFFGNCLLRTCQKILSRLIWSVWEPCWLRRGVQSAYKIPLKCGTCSLPPWVGACDLYQVFCFLVLLFQAWIFRCKYQVFKRCCFFWQVDVLHFCTVGAMAMFYSNLWVSFSIFPGLHPLFGIKYAPHQNAKIDTHTHTHTHTQNKHKKTPSRLAVPSGKVT